MGTSFSSSLKMSNLIGEENTRTDGTFPSFLTDAIQSSCCKYIVYGIDLPRALGLASASIHKTWCGQMAAINRARLRTSENNHFKPLIFKPLIRACLRSCHKL